MQFVSAIKRGRLFNSAEIATFTPQEKRKYELDMRTERDLHNQIEYARKDGARKAALETARKLLDKGIEPEVVMECTGLTEADLAAL